MPGCDRVAVPLVCDWRQLYDSWRSGSARGLYASDLQHRGNYAGNDPVNQPVSANTNSYPSEHMGWKPVQQVSLLSCHRA